jgi:transposase-like protein
MQMARRGQGIGIVEGLQGGFGGEDFLRELVQRTVQQVLEAEMTSFLGAGTYERNGERRGWRNGYKPRTLKTRVGELELMVPKDRDDVNESAGPARNFLEEIKVVPKHDLPARSG